MKSLLDYQFHRENTLKNQKKKILQLVKLKEIEIRCFNPSLLHSLIHCSLLHRLTPLISIRLDTRSGCQGPEILRLPNFWSLFLLLFPETVPSSKIPHSFFNRGEEVLVFFPSFAGRGRRRRENVIGRRERRGMRRDMMGR